jgi:hypothetical protein
VSAGKTQRFVGYSSLTAAEKTHSELVNQLRERDAHIENYRRNELAYKDELERLHLTRAKFVSVPFTHASYFALKGSRNARAVIDT